MQNLTAGQATKDRQARGYFGVDYADLTQEQRDHIRASLAAQKARFPTYAQRQALKKA